MLSVAAHRTLVSFKRTTMNKARDLTLTFIFLLASIVAFSATHKDAKTPEETKPTPKYKASSALGLNLLGLFMLRPVKQDSTAIRLESEAILTKEEE